MPSALMVTWGVNAGTSPGDWSIRTGALQCRPPSVDRDRAILACPSGLNRPSCHTAYRSPVAGSAVKAGMPSPVRTACPPMVTGALMSWLTMTGLDQVAPPSAERITATLETARGLLPFPPLVRIWTKPSTSAHMARSAGAGTGRIVRGAARHQQVQQRAPALGWGVAAAAAAAE